MGIKCSICGSINDSTARRCGRCGRALPDVSACGASIWSGETGRKNSASVPERPTGKIVRCRDCGYTEPLKNGMIPLFCPVCSYGFTVDDVRDENEPERTVSRPESAVPAEKSGRRGPMRRAAAVERRLELRFPGAGNTAARSIDPSGETLLFGGTEAAFTRAGSDWYLMLASGTAGHNEETVAAGVSRRLSDGDLLLIGERAVRIAISEGEGGPVTACGTELRLVCSRNGVSTAVSPEATGGLIGGSGALRVLSAPGTERKYIWVWHGKNGWSFRTLADDVLYNGEKLNKGLKRKLADGDLLNMGQSLVRADISGK